MSAPAIAQIGFRQRLAARGVDGVTLLILPALLLLLAVFVYPFLYGLWLSFAPREGGVFGNYVAFFTDPFQYATIWTTLALALPVTIISLHLASPREDLKGAVRTAGTGLDDLAANSALRDRQSAYLAAAAAKAVGPVVVVGDFNSPDIRPQPSRVCRPDMTILP